MRKYLFALFFLLSAVSVHSQTDSLYIYGHVVDGFTGEQLPGATIRVSGPSGRVLVETMVYGNNKRGSEETILYSCNVARHTRYKFHVSLSGYKDIELERDVPLRRYGKRIDTYSLGDIEIFPVLNAIFEGIYGENPYKSPTDMGVNMAGYCIFDDEACREASNQEIIRRYYTALDDLIEDKGTEEIVNKIALVMKQAKITPEDRRVVVPANERGNKACVPAAAIELEDGTIITSETSSLLGTCAALILNATKHLAGIDHKEKLIPKDMIEPIQNMKVNYLKGNNPRLHTDEVLVALAMLSPTNENCKKALEQLPKLNGCQVHTTVMLSEVDRKIFKKLGVGLTSEPVLKKSSKR